MPGMAITSSQEFLPPGGNILRYATIVGLLVFAAFSFCWALNEAVATYVGSDLVPYAARIVDGERFKADALLALRPELDRLENSTGEVRPAVLRSVALIELRLAEIDLIAGHSVAGNPQFDRAATAVRRSLAVSSQDSFLWYASFWLDKARHGFRLENQRDLTLSYQTGPNEGWIAVHRNRDSVALLTALPPNLQTLVLQEFRNLVASNYIDDAANILTGPGWPQHDALASALEGLPLTQLRSFSAVLDRRDVEVAIPGLQRKPRKPWDFAPG